MMPSNHLILCHPFLLSSVFPSIRVFSSESALRIRWPKYWSFIFSISSCSESSGLTSFRIDWFGILAAQGNRKSLPQHHNLNPSILQSQTSLWSNSHICTRLLEKTALTIWTFVGKMMSLLFKMLSGFATAFLTRSKHLLNSWLQSPSAVILEPPKNKVCHCFLFLSFLFAIKWWNRMPWSVFWMLSFKPAFSLSSFTFTKSLFSSFPLSVIRVVSSAYLRLLIFVMEILSPAFDSSSLAFLMITLHINYISRVIIYSLDTFLSRFWTSPLLYVQF